MKTTATKYDLACDWVAHNRFKTCIGAILALILFNLAMPDTPKQSSPATAEITNPQQREFEAKQKQEANKIAVMELALKQVVTQYARDPSSVQFGKTQRFKNGVCIPVNAKNGFGGYTGFSEYCYLEEKGKPVLTKDGRTDF
jgi:hypothetical protein